MDNKLLKNIIEYYLGEIMEMNNIDRNKAYELLNNALQNENVENKIFENLK